ncbi:nucleotide-binding alpha-beta plait domain-containing protein [Tanacetum coccineum]
MRSPLFNTGSKHEGNYEVNQDEGKEDKKGNPDPSHNVVNFFFTNFPPDWNKTDLHGLFAEVGEIAELYVARKVSKAGRKFGFARFFRVGSLRALENRLNIIRIGNFNLRANIAMFEKPVSDFKKGSKRDEWVFYVPSKSKQSPMVNLSSSPNHLVDESFVIHSLFELQSIWSSFNTSNCKVNYMGGSKFSIEFKNEEGDGLPRADDVRSVDEDVKIDIESNNIINSGSNSICGEINDLMGMDMKCINAYKVVITKDFAAEDESTKADEDDEEARESVKEGENSKSEFDLKYKHEEEACDSCSRLSNASENDLSSYFVDDNKKEKESKLCDTTKEKDGSLSCDEDNIGFKPKPSKLDLERIILYSSELRPNMTTKEIREGFASFNPTQTSSIKESHPTSLKGSIHQLGRKKTHLKKEKTRSSKALKLLRQTAS